MSRSTRRLLALGALIPALALAACDSGAGTPSNPVLRVGYLSNLTHATPLVGVENGIFRRSLGNATKLETLTFNAGPAAVEALNAGSLDAAYLGPSPAITAFLRSHGQSIRVIAGATSGGASLVVKPAIKTAADLRGKKIADPQLGGTQDVALRTWLKGQGMSTDTSGGGDVSVTPQANALSLQTFRSGEIDGAWVPEPWVTQMVAEGGRILVDERSLWPGGRFITTLLVVRTAYLTAHPDIVRSLLEGHYQTTAFIRQDPPAAQAAARVALQRLTGKAISDAQTRDAWSRMEFVNDPLASTLLVVAQHSSALGLSAPGDVGGIFDLGPLNEVLGSHNEQPVSAQ